MRRAFRAAAAFDLMLGSGACGAADPAAPLDAMAPGREAAAPAANDIARTLAQAARPITGGESDYADLLAAAGGTRRVLLGESTHGTHEYYRERGRITEALIERHGFNAVAIEGDWTPIRRLNDYVRGLGTDRSAAEAMGGLTRFPEWMWRNAEFAGFVERLRAINAGRPAERRVALYGMDVYDLFDAADAALAYLRTADPAAAKRAEAQYRCFRRFGRKTEAYGEATRNGTDCRRQAEAVLAELRRIPRPAGAEAAERHFAALRAAASVVAAEAYFRTAYSGSMAWNVRDQSMAATVEEIAAHAEAMSGQPGKVVMWSHNSHSGDARATDAANRGELNLGQLMRQRHGDQAFLVGFFSHGGTVLAAPDWGEAGRVYDMRAALAGSHAALFRRLGLPAFSLVLRGNRETAALLERPMEQRAIGVVYRPGSERLSHYFDARLAEQFDAAVYFDRSKAVSPLPHRPAPSRPRAGG
jgi:erythromycin esterase-like protein